MDRENLTAGAFAENIGVSQATISHIMSSRNKYPSTEVILRLHQRYSDINLEWLLTGKGQMDAGNKSENQGEKEASSSYPLFAENPEIAANGSDGSENRKEMASKTPQSAVKEIIKQEIVYKERAPRKITEIRIFFDDNTYETFKPGN